MIAVGFLMADSIDQVAKRFPKTKFAIIDNSGVAAEFKKVKPTNVRGMLFKEQEAGYLVGFLAAKQVVAKPFEGQTKLGAVGGLKIPPVDRFIAGYYAGAKRASAKVTVTHNYSQDFVDQAKCKEQALSMIANGAGAVFQVAGQCGLGVLSAAKERGVFGIGVDADQGYLGAHVMTSATKKVDVAVYKTIEAARKAPVRSSSTNTSAIFTVANGGVGYGKISSRVSPALRQQVEAVRKLLAAGKIKGIPQSPPANHGLGERGSTEGAGFRSRPFRYYLRHEALAAARAARAPARARRLRQRRRRGRQATRPRRRRPRRRRAVRPPAKG